ncbi:hypothetical protein C8J57DRAFT_1504782 [Mycena rebaudengoi]|nr:hypothetical protein C8J57DRAFT_1504782 [Mycena rebaudengoi]
MPSDQGEALLPEPPAEPTTILVSMGWAVIDFVRYNIAHAIPVLLICHIPYETLNNLCGTSFDFKRHFCTLTEIKSTTVSGFAYPSCAEYSVRLAQTKWTRRTSWMATVTALGHP